MNNLGRTARTLFRNGYLIGAGYGKNNIKYYALGDLSTYKVVYIDGQDSGFEKDNL